MKQYLYRIQPTRTEMLIESTPHEDEMVSQHFNRLKQLTSEGVVILAGRTLNVGATSFGIVIFKAESDEAARAIVEEDPAVKSGVFSAELFPYAIALINQANVS